MKKLLFLCVALFTFSSEKANGCCNNVLNGVGLGGYWELSETYYPKTVKYFDALRVKYPEALKNIPIIIWSGPCADNDTIYFAHKWIEELEKGNKFYKEMTEWILLHEAGHIHNLDIVKSQIALASMIVAPYLIDAVVSSLDLSLNNRNKIAVGSLAVVMASYVSMIYMQATREYAADDFAMKHCSNPQAWIAAYEFLDRFAPLGFLPGIAHSFTKYRLSRIKAEFKNKFGYELVVVPQSVDPSYDKDEPVAVVA
ncbi:MAG: M48 family metalloprotease [Candidatus Babeliales bacterium]|jgi:hypothetical protein